MRSRWTVLAIALCVGLITVGVLRMGSVSEVKAWVQVNLPSLYPQLRQAAYDIDGEPEGGAESLGVPLMQLHLSRPDVAHFANLYARYEDPRFGVSYYAANNRWRKATLTHEGTTYRVRVKSHGRSPTSHRAGRFISYSIKLRDGLEIHGAKRFNLIIRERVQPERHLGLDVAQRLDVVAHRLRPVRLQINAWQEKLYYFEHRLNPAEMEVTGRPSWRLYGANEPFRSRSLVYTEASGTPQDFHDALAATLAAEEVPESHRDSILARYDAFNEAIAEGRCEEMTRFVDVDYTANVLAARLISGFLGHGNWAGNLYVFFNGTTGEFHPTLTRDHVPRPLEVTDVPLEAQVNLRGGRTRPHPSHFFLSLSCNDTLRQAAYRRIADFSRAHSETIRDEHIALLERHERLSYLGWARIIARRMGKGAYDFSADNLTILMDYLSAADPEVSLEVAGATLRVQITPRSMSALQVTGLTVPTATGALDLTAHLASHRFSTGLDMASARVTRTYGLEIDLGGAVATGPPALTLVNTVTGAPVVWRAVDARQVTDPVTPAADVYTPWRARHPTLRVTRREDGAVVFPAGVHTLEEDVVLPKGARLVLSAGAHLRLGPSRVLVGWAGLEVSGTATQPVIIEPIDPAKPYGSVGVLGSPTIANEVRHLHQRGGSERWVEGAFFSGGLSIHARGGPVTIDHLRVSENRADDGLNVKNAGWVTLTNSRFEGNFADQVDLDDCDGVVSGSSFVVTPGGDANGDGLDVSLSTIFVTDSRFDGQPDKGISVGERSQVFVWKNTFKGNGNGIAVKDRSDVWLADNSFSENTRDVAVYRKKAIFGGGHVYLTDAASRTLVTELDELSSRHLYDPAGARSLLTGEPVTELGPLFDALRQGGQP